MMKIEEDTRERYPTHSWTGAVNIINMSVLCKVIYRMRCDPYQNSSGIVHRNKEILKFELNRNFVWDHKKTELPKQFLRQKNKGRGLTGSNFKLYYKDIVI